MSDSQMEKLNKQVFNKDGSTDVVSFPIDEVLPNGKYLLGELVINQDAVMQNSRKYQVSYAQELARVVAHGVLHLLGFEDKTKVGLQRMKAIEDAVVEEVQKYA